jgi:tRNA (Thr-GGU) A37 N-methylase
MTRIELKPIGSVESPLLDLGAAPRQPDEGAPDAWLVFRPEVLEGLRSLKPGTEVMLLTWLHRASRDVLSVHPRAIRTGWRKGFSVPARRTVRTPSGCTGSKLWR